MVYIEKDLMYSTEGNVDETLFQEIQCNGSDTQNSYAVSGSDVIVKPSKLHADSDATASNKVKVSQISKYDWEEKYYFGNLVSCNNTYISYVLRARDNNRDDTIRVINQQTSTRALLKGFTQRIQDVAFESLKSNKFASADSVGTLHVFEFFEENGCVKSKLLLEIKRKRTVSVEECRVVWAPNLLLPIDAHETMIGMSIGNTAEAYNIQEILRSKGPGTFMKKEIGDGVITIPDCHQKPITCLALSPDMQVLATSSLDGDVKFWSLNLEEDMTPNCLHEWDPHNGEPVTSLFFCDDLLISDDSSPFWRYLITGTAYNSVLKIWCAVKWECIQTIRFTAVENSLENPDRCFKISLDLTAKYLLLSDIKRPVLYICQLHPDVEREKTTVVSVSEFILRDPILSFSIFVAKERKLHQSMFTGNEDGSALKALNGVVDQDISNDTKEEEEEEEEGEEEYKKRMSVVTLFAIQKKALQKLSIKFNTNVCVDLPSIPTNTSPSQEDLLSIRDGLSDVDISENSVTGENRPPSESSDDSVSVTWTTQDTSNVLTNVTEIAVTPDQPTNNPLVVVEKEEKSPQLIHSISGATTSSLDAAASVINDTLQTPSMMTSLISDRESLTSEPGVVSTNGTIAKQLMGESNLMDNVVKDAMVPNVSPIHWTDDRKTTIGFDYPVVGSSSVGNIHDVYVMLTKQQHIISSQQQMISAQQKELGEIKDLLQILVKRHSVATSAPGSTLASDEDSREEIKVHMQLLQKSATSQFSKANKEFNKQCNQRLEQFTKEVNTCMQGKEERFVQILSNIVNNTIAMKLEKTIKSEMKQKVLSSVDQTMSKHFENIDKQVAQKISVWERTLREETTELIKSKSLSESIGHAAASILEGSIPNAYRETFKNVLLPGFEKASMAMFIQINQTFQQGTKQYLEKLESHLESKKQRHQELQDPMIANLQDLVNSFQGTADRLTSGVESNLEALMQKQLRETTDRMQNTFGNIIESAIVPSLSKTIGHCVRNAFKEWQTTIDNSLCMIQNVDSMSHSAIEDDIEQKKASITAHIKNGDLYKAFEVALSASDLNIVLFTCEQVDPVNLFQESSIVFPQPIILSLIQQLSQNLSKNTDLKTRYLEESIMALKLDEEITRTHMPGILRSLNDQLSLTIDHLHKNDPGNKKIKALRMLHMATKSILHGDFTP